MEYLLSLQLVCMHLAQHGSVKDIEIDTAMVIRSSVQPYIRIQASTTTNFFASNSAGVISSRFIPPETLPSVVNDAPGSQGFEEQSAEALKQRINETLNSYLDLANGTEDTQLLQQIYQKLRLLKSFVDRAQALKRRRTMPTQAEVDSDLTYM